MPAQVATLEVDLSAIAENYSLLKACHARKTVAAVVKADAYGLGMKAVAARLWQEGCRQFFVATLGEGVALRKQLPDARIGVFHGVLAGEETLFVANRLAPVLNDAGQLERWITQVGLKSPAMLHVDTGMTRLGISQRELENAVARHPEFMRGLAALLSHLACGNEPAHPKNAEQLARFKKAAALLPNVPKSFANSSGHFLPPEYHFDFGRPGCALYGITPVETANPMRQVTRLTAPILQLRTVEQPEAVGYGATAQLQAGGRIATVALGYADGWPRALSSAGHAFVAGVRVPVLGRVSMDMTALDVSAVPLESITAKTRVEFIGPQQSVDDVARACGTIGYEIYTGLGPRIKRLYRA